MCKYSVGTVDTSHGVLKVGASASPFLLITSPSPVLGHGGLFWGLVVSPLLRNSDHLSMATVAWVNISHPFLCRAVPTVMQVRRNRDGSCWNSEGHFLSQHGWRHDLRHIMIYVVREKPGAEAGAWASRWLRSRPGLGWVVDCAWGQGSEESLLALEARARASRYLCSRPGLGRVATCAWGRGSSESLIAYVEGKWVPVDLSPSFAAFFPLG